jgi:hypothetical protein
MGLETNGHGMTLSAAPVPPSWLQRPISSRETRNLLSGSEKRRGVLEDRFHLVCEREYGDQKGLYYRDVNYSS